MSNSQPNIAKRAFRWLRCRLWSMGVIPNKPPYCGGDVGGLPFAIDCKNWQIDIDQPLSQQIDVSGGVGPYFFNLVGAPAWLSIDQQGVISGTTSTPGTYTFQVTATDQIGNQLECTVQIEVFDEIPDLAIDCPDSIITIGCYQGTSFPAVTYTGQQLLQFTLGVAPAWMAINAQTGEISYTAAPTPGSYPFQIDVTDGDMIANCSGEIIVEQNQPPVIDCPTDPLIIEVNEPYFHTFTATDPEGADVEFSYDILNFIPNFTLSPDGELAGIATDIGTGTFEICATDDCSNTVCCTVAYEVVETLGVDGGGGGGGDGGRTVNAPMKLAMNTSFHTYWSAEQPLYDKAKFASLTRDGVTFAESDEFPVDEYGWGTEVGPVFNLLWYTNEQAVKANNDYENFLEDEDWRVLYDGVGDIRVEGRNIVADVLRVNDNEFSLRIVKGKIGNARVKWTNTDEGDHIRNVRVVPARVAPQYRDWHWGMFNPASDDNPEIFDKCWFDKVNAFDAFRFATATGINDWTQLETNPWQEHSKWLVMASDANFYDTQFSGLGHTPGKGGIRNFAWPPELIGYLARRTGVRPHINCEVGIWANLQDDDDYIERWCDAFYGSGYRGELKVEVGNELWNKSGAFSVGNKYMMSGPHPKSDRSGDQRAVAEHYALISNDVIKEFRAHAPDTARVTGVFNAQHYNTGFFTDARDLIDTDVVTSLETGAYYANDIELSPGSDLAVAITKQLDDAPERLNQKLYREFTSSDWIGAGTARPEKHDLVLCCEQIKTHSQLARKAGMTYSIYECGLHLNIRGFKGRQLELTPQDARIRDSVLNYLDSRQAHKVCQELLKCASDNDVLDLSIFSMISSTSMTQWSVWDRNCDEDTPRARALLEYNKVNGVTSNG